MPRFMPMFVQVKTPTNLKRQIEGTLEESIFPPSRAQALPVGKSACSELTGVFPVLPPGVGIAKVAEELPSTFPRPTPREGTGNQVP